MTHRRRHAAVMACSLLGLLVGGGPVAIAAPAAAGPRGASAAEPPPRLGRFERQIDGIGACRAVALDASGDVILVDGLGRLVGGPEAGAPGNLRDLAVDGAGGLFVIGDAGLSHWSAASGWRRLGGDAGIAIGVADGTIGVLEVDGTLVAHDATDDGLRERWRQAAAFPGARGIVGLPDGGLWIADTDRHRIVRLDDSGKIVRKIGARGAFPGLFNTPVDLAVAGDRLFVADMLNHRISSHELETGAFLDQWGMHAVVPREGEGRIHYPEGIAVSPDAGAAVVMEPFERRYQVFGPVPEGETPSGATLPPKRGVESHFGTDLAADGLNLAMWEPESATAVAFDLRFGIPIHVASFGHGGPPPVGFGRIVAAGVDGRRREIWLVDAGHRRIHRWMLRSERPDELIFDPFMGRFARGWAFDTLCARIAERAAGDASMEAGDLRPTDLVVADGTLHLLDAAGPAIVVADRTLEVSQVIPLPEGTSPTQLAVRADGGWLVVDGEQRRLLGIGPDGAVDRDLDLAALGFVHPFGVVEIDDLVVVSDRETDRLVSLDAEGGVVAVAGETGAWDGGLWRPAGLAAIPWADDGTIVAVVDQGNHRAQGFDPRTGEWKVSFSLGQGHDRVQLRREDFEPSDDPASEPGAGTVPGKESEATP